MGQSVSCGDGTTRQGDVCVATQTVSCGNGTTRQGDVCVASSFPIIDPSLEPWRIDGNCEPGMNGAKNITISTDHFLHPKSGRLPPSIEFHADCKQPKEDPTLADWHFSNGTCKAGSTDNLSIELPAATFWKRLAIEN